MQITNYMIIDILFRIINVPQIRNGLLLWLWCANPNPLWLVVVVGFNHLYDIQAYNSGFSREMPTKATDVIHKHFRFYIFPQIKPKHYNNSAEKRVFELDDTYYDQTN